MLNSYNGQFQTYVIRLVAVGFNNLDGYSGFLSVCMLSVESCSACRSSCYAHGRKIAFGGVTSPTLRTENNTNHLYLDIQYSRVRRFRVRRVRVS